MFTVAAENAFDFRSLEYGELFRYAKATVFQNPIWLHHLYGRLAPALGADPLVITVRTDDERLAMVLPLLRRRSGVMKVVEFADLQVSDYASPVCSDALWPLIAGDPTVPERIAELLEPFDVLQIQKVREDGFPIEDLFPDATREPTDVVARAVPLSSPFTAWCEKSLTPAYRQELDRKWRQLERKGKVQFTLLYDADSIRAALNAIRRFRAARIGGASDDVLQDPARHEFHANVAVDGRGTFARTYTLSVDGRCVAAALGLSHQHALALVLSGFDMYGYRNQSVGALLFEQIARDCIERGDTLLDFTIGDDPYSRSFGTQPHNLYGFSQSGSSLGAIASVAIGRGSSIRETVRRLIRRGLGETSDTERDRQDVARSA